MNASVIIALVLVALVGLILWLQRRNPVLQYLYLGRYSLLTAVALIGCAPFALFIATSLLQNLFVLSSWWEITLVTWFAILAAWVVMMTVRLVLGSTPYFFPTMQSLSLPAWPEQTIALLFALAALPTIAAIVYSSTDLSFVAKLGGVGIGLGVAWGVRALTDRTLTRLAQSTWLAPLRSLLLAPLEKAGYPTGRNSAGQRVTAKGHEVALAYLLFTVIVYILGYFVLRPDRPWINRVQVPALVYILLLFMLLGWLLPGIALYLDRFRIPTSLAFVLLSFLFWAFVNTDYYYAVKPSSELKVSQQQDPLTPLKAFASWHGRHPIADYPTMVVVTTSGGGIKAAYWTTQVLTALQQMVGEKFSSSIVLITAASGGSVGTMYFVDAYTEQGAPPMDKLDAIKAAAGSPSLAPAAWGIIYPDFWRATFALAGKWKPLQDRGWAMEQSWARQLNTPERTFADWRTGIAAGWRPPVIFNTTIVETGERLLLTPLDQGIRVDESNVFSRPRYFSTLYPGYDIPVVTAARLSATFPYVTPIARAIDTPAEKDYHLADGGYYDNFGVVSALEWLNMVLPQAQQLGRDKVLFIQIEASPFSEDGLPLPNDNAGWLYNLAGPLVTALNVQTTAQQQRNSMEFRIFEKAYKEIAIKRVKFTFGADGPLSWQLSPHDIKLLQEDLNSPANTQALAIIKDYFATLH